MQASRSVPPAPAIDRRIRRKVWASTAGAFAVGGVTAVTFGAALATLITGAVLRQGIALSAEEIEAVGTVVVFLVSGITSAAGAFVAGWITPERSPHQ